MGIGARLEKLIKTKKMNVNELANKANVTPSTLYSIIKRDNMKVDLDILVRICEVLGVSVDYFCDSENEKGYYNNPETAKLAQELYDNPDRRVLLDATRDLRPEDVKALTLIISQMKKKESSD